MIDSHISFNVTDYADIFMDNVLSDCVFLVTKNEYFAVCKTKDKVKESMLEFLGVILLIGIIGFLLFTIGIRLINIMVSMVKVIIGIGALIGIIMLFASCI